jgi:hypothetical protein
MQVLEGERSPTGREIHMEESSPFFSTVAGGMRAIELGFLAVNISLFEQLRMIIEEANATENELPEGGTN